MRVMLAACGMVTALGGVLLASTINPVRQDAPPTAPPVTPPTPTAPPSATPDDRFARTLPPGQALIDLVNSLKPSIVTLTVSDEDGIDVASSTAFLLTESLLITNHGALVEGVKARVTLATGQTIPVEQVVGEMKEVNLTLIAIKRPEHVKPESLKPLPLATRAAGEGDEFIVISASVDRDHAVARGKATKREHAPDLGDVVRAEVNFLPGSTAAPVLNGKGEVIGAAGFAKVGEKTERFIVPADRLLALRVSAEGGKPVTLAEYRDQFGGSAGRSRQPEEPIKLEATIVKREDGSLLIDDQYVVRGEGTEANPYKITWDLLYSAARVYRPREGKDKLPERITFLHDKWVEMPGYVAFPLMTNTSREILLMLNQWDGCCIGVPPTPYDAIEVTLVDEVTVEGGLNIFNYGTVRGKLKVDPYVVNKWLVGLYLMEDAKLALDDK